MASRSQGHEHRFRGSLLRLIACSALLSVAERADSQRVDTLRIFSPRDEHPRDPNGFLLNPRWYGNDSNEPPDLNEVCKFRAATGHLERRTLFVTSGLLPGCLSAAERRLVSLTEVATTLGLGAVCVTGSKTGGIRGHVNWFPMTATGQLKWSAFSKGVGDHDVNLDLIPRDSIDPREPPGRFHASAVTQRNEQFEEYGNRRGTTPSLTTRKHSS